LETEKWQLSCFKKYFENISKMMKLIFLLSSRKKILTLYENIIEFGCICWFYKRITFKLRTKRIDLNQRLFLTMAIKR